MQLSGVCPVVPTPFTDDGSLALGDYRSVLTAIIEGGCDAAVIFGIASEFHKLTYPERQQLLEVAVEVCAGEIPLVVSVPDHSTNVATERARDAERAGADAVMALPPTFLDPASSDQIAHIERIAAAVDLPVMMQYAPETTGIDLAPADFDDLNDRAPNVDHFKVESHPCGPDITALVEEGTGDYQIFMGLAGLQMIEALQRGAVGVMPGAGIHDVYLEIYAAHRAGEHERARSIHDDLLPLLNHVRQTPEMLICYEKRMLERRGWLEHTGRRDPKFARDDQYDELFEAYYGTVEQHFRR